MKYIIDVSDEAIELMGGHISIFVEPVFKTGDCKHYALRISKGDITPYTESDRKAIEDEVWEFAKKIGSFNGLSKHELDECFGHTTIQGVMTTYDTYQEAKEKYEAWRKQKEQKDEIHVGDEVYDHTISETGIVTNVENKNMVGIMWDDGSVNDSVSVKDLRKTGRHFDEVEDLLKKIKEK